jgi:hypothetical protein
MSSKLAVSILALVAYAAVARAVDNLYPFSTFSMYSGVVTDTASRIAVRGSDGVLREVSEYDAWELPPAPERNECVGERNVYVIPYVDQEAGGWIEAHRGAGSDAVLLVRHVWHFEANALREEDCVIYRAKATRH